MKSWPNTRRRTHVLDEALVVELWRNVANDARTGNARWRGMSKLAACGKCVDDDQESAPDRFVGQLTTRTEDRGSLDEQEAMPTRRSWLD
jgi:hypothetical protein